MTAEGASSEFSTWTAAGHAIQIHYRNDVMNAISDAAWEGLQKIPRRGLEVGGVLYGEREDDEIRILEWRPIACEHSNGPGFDLSESDREALRSQLHDSDAAPPGPIPVGWFHSRTKDGIFLSEADIALYNSHFPAMWQVALVVRPHLHETPRAGFFFREQDGSIQAERSHAEFELARRTRRLPVGFDPSNPSVRSPLRDGSPAGFSTPESLAEPFPQRHRQERAPRRAPAFGYEAARPSPPPQAARKGRWGVWLMAAFIVVALAVLLGAPLLEPGDSDDVALRATDTGGQLVLQWNHQAPAVQAAESGVLRVLDGPAQREIPLTGQEIRSGSITYIHTTGDVEFQLDLTIPDEGTQSLATRFIGMAPETSVSTENASRRSLLEMEAETLQRQLADEAARNSELRDTVSRMRSGGADQ